MAWYLLRFIPDSGDCGEEYSSTETVSNQDPEPNLKYDDNCNNSTLHSCTQLSVLKSSPESFPDDCSRTKKEQKFKDIKPRANFEKDIFPVKRSFVRWFGIGKLPDCLCIHLQRLVWVGGMPVKKTQFVSFPEVLDARSYTDAMRQARKKQTVTNSRSMTKPKEILQAINENMSFKYGMLNEREDVVLEGNSEHKNGTSSVKK